MNEFLERFRRIIESAKEDFQWEFGEGVDFMIENNKIIFESELGVFQLTCEELQQPEEGFFMVNGKRVDTSVEV